MGMRAEPGANPTRLLVVEDEEVLNDLLATFFVDEGFQVATALDGRRALEMIETGDFDAVILDLGLPGLDGKRILAEALARWPDLPMLVLSGYITPDDREGLLKQGASAVLSKPTDLAELASNVRGLLGNAAPKG